MAHQEDILKLRARFEDAIKLGMYAGSSDLVLATLISILNDAERERTRNQEIAQKFREQAYQSEGRAHAFSLVGSMVYNVLNGFIAKSEQASVEEKERLNEKSGDGSAKE